MVPSAACEQGENKLEEGDGGAAAVAQTNKKSVDWLLM
jgi:hypothetical protein